MYNCYTHGWTSHYQTCPACTTINTGTSSGEIAINSSHKYEVSDKETIDNLNKKLGIAVKALKGFAAYDYVDDSDLGRMPQNEAEVIIAARETLEEMGYEYED